MFKKFLSCVFCTLCCFNVFGIIPDNVKVNEIAGKTSFDTNTNDVNKSENNTAKNLIESHEETLLSASSEASDLTKISDKSSIIEADDEKLTELQELSEPYRYISGAYIGVGLGYSRIPLKTDVTRTHFVNANNDRRITKLSFKKTAGQLELAMLAGFGSVFQKIYYAGLELEFSKRFSKHKSQCKDNNELYLVHKPVFGLNMNIRFGYQFPIQGILIYGTIGFAKLRGEICLKKHNRKEYPSQFGTYSPTIGLGAEYRLNYDWNLRIDAKYSIPKKKNKLLCPPLKENPNADFPCDLYKYKGRVSKMTVKFYVTHNF